MFIFSDPPDHTRVRNLFMPLMTPVAVKALEQYIRDRTRALLQPHLAGGQIDFVADFGCFLPMDVIATMTGVPVDDQDRVRGWAEDLIARDDKQHDLSERNLGGRLEERRGGTERDNKVRSGWSPYNSKKK